MSLKLAREMETETETRTFNDDFPALEEKIYKAIELLKSAREGKAAAERDAGRLREQLETREEELDVLRGEMIALKKSARKSVVVWKRCSSRLMPWWRKAEAWFLDSEPRADHAASGLHQEPIKVCVEKALLAVWSTATKMNVPHNMTTTQFELHGFEVVQTLGMVRGIIVRSRSIFGTIGASLQTLVGGNITLLTNLCERTRQEALDLMLQHAGQLGANAVVGVRYDATEIMQGVTEVLAYGTAVVVNPKSS